MVGMSGGADRPSGRLIGRPFGRRGLLAGMGLAPVLAPAIARAQGAPRRQAEPSTSTSQGLPPIVFVHDPASNHLPPLPEVTEVLGMVAAPDLYRAVAVWPGYLQVAWEELQHLGAYPDFRRRGRQSRRFSDPIDKAPGRRLSVRGLRRRYRIGGSQRVDGEHRQ